MAQFTLTIDTDNDAFAEDTHAEIARILHNTAERIVSGLLYDGLCRDYNGNTVGSFELVSVQA